MNREAPKLSPAHHGDGGFQNPWPNSRPRGFGAVIKWMLTRSRDTSPQPLPALSPPTAAIAIPERSAELAVTWIGHSTFLIQCDGLNILTDPIWSERASPLGFAGPRRLVPPGIAFGNLPNIDLTVISHDHYDHFDDCTIRKLASRFPEMTWCVPVGLASMVAQRGANQIVEMDWWDEREISKIRVACTPAQHFSGRYPWNRDTTLWCGWTLAFPNANVFFAGDTALHPEFTNIAARLGPFDVSILPIGAYEPRWFMRVVHMTPEDSVAAFEQIAAAHPAHAPSIMLGSHWGTFRLTDEPVMQPPQLARSRWIESGLDPDRLWILTHGETRVLPSST